MCEDYPKYNDYQTDIIKLNNIKLEEYETRPYLWMQIICLVCCIFGLIASYITLHFVMQIYERLQNARFIQF